MSKPAPIKVANNFGLADPSLPDFFPDGFVLDVPFDVPPDAPFDVPPDVPLELLLHISDFSHVLSST